MKEYKGKYRIVILDDSGMVCNEVIVDKKTCEFLIGLIETTLKELHTFELRCRKGFKYADMSIMGGNK
jgi:hypothetical protein